MRVAVFVPSLASMGPVILARDLVEGLKSRVEEVVVYYFSSKTDITFNCQCYKIEFTDEIDFNRYQVLHSHGLRPDAYLFKNRKKIKGKMISTMHIYMKEDFRYTYNKLVAWFMPVLWRYLLSRHDKVVTLSRDMTAYYVELGIPQSKLDHAYNSRDIQPSAEVPEEDRKAISALKGNRTLLGVSATLTGRKGVHQLIKLLKVRTDLALVIIGSGPEAGPLGTLASRLGVEDRILAMGHRQDAQRYFNLFDIYAMTSYSEGFPLVLIEAAHHGCRVVCSDIPIFRELFTDEEVAFFVLDDIQSLSNAVSRAATGDMHKRFSNTMLTKYSMAAMVDRYLEIYAA